MQSLLGYLNETLLSGGKKPCCLSGILESLGTASRSVSIAAEPSAVVPVEQKQEIQHHPMPEKGGHWDKGRTV